MVWQKEVYHNQEMAKVKNKKIYSSEIVEE